MSLARMAMMIVVLISLIGCSGDQGSDAGGRRGRDTISIEGPVSVSISFDGIGPNGIKLSGPMVSVDDENGPYWLILKKPVRIRTKDMVRVTGRIVVDTSGETKNGQWLEVDKLEFITP